MTNQNGNPERKKVTQRLFVFLWTGEREQQALGSIYRIRRRDEYSWGRLKWP